MKYLIASDIHGSAYFCEKLLSAFEVEKASRLILLGDLLYHGPRNELPRNYDPVAVAAMLNKINSKIICVRGNCDSEVDQMVLAFPIMADYALFEAQNRLIFLTHGHVYCNANLPKISKNDILLNGHTHVPSFKIYDTHIYINPGSVALPKENSPHSYIILDDNEFVWKDLNDMKVYKSCNISHS